VALGVYILVFREHSAETLGAIVGAALIVWGLFEVVMGLWTRKRSSDWSWRIVKGLIALTGGVLGVLFPVDMVLIIFTGFALVWAFTGVLAIWYGLSAPADEQEKWDPYEIVKDWFTRREFDAEDRKRVVDNLFYEGPKAKERLSRFAILMGLSVAIASFAVIQDSTAVVIGAMLIAPLMTPIMATSAAIIMGWPKRAARAALTVLGGAVGGIALAFLIGTYIPALVSLADNSQIASRTSPTLLDLLIALTAGAAGAFAMTREDVSDSLPGVAIAVALVPPLSVVGITLSLGAFDESRGALLLFMTNLVCIILSGTVVFVLTGFAPIFRLKQRVSSIRVALGTVVLGALIIMVPLAATGAALLREAAYLGAAERATDAWIPDDSNARVLRIDVIDTTIEVIVGGPEDPPPLEELAHGIEAELGSDDFALDLEWIVSDSETYP
jgi:uncharacterized hydrophobic protein (TIGR00271 family)